MAAIACTVHGGGGNKKIGNKKLVLTKLDIAGRITIGSIWGYRGVGCRGLGRGLVE